MAVFDLQEQKIFVRIVYDGAAGAGKTTNIHKLSELFTTRRRSELYSPEDLDGRTLFFDWLQVASGLVMGFPVICQVITVPGQDALGPRRRHLLATADFVVLVVESTERGLERAERSLPLLVEARQSREVPVLVQANKQDLEGAIGADRIAQRLGLGEGTRVLAASASESTGVLETFVSAIRSVTEHIQARALEGGGLEVITAESAEQLYGELARVQLDPDWRDKVLSVAPPPLPAPPAEEPRRAVPISKVPTLRPDGAAVSVAQVEPSPALASEPPTEPRAQTLPIEAVSEAGWDVEVPDLRSPSPPRVISTVPPQVSPVKDGRLHCGEIDAPLPTHDVPTGFIWPASTGREILRTLDYGTLVVRSDLVGQPGSADGSGKSDTILCKVGGWCLKTSARRQFRDADAARSALLRAAREKTTLGELLMPETVLALQPDADGSFWLWTVTPWLRTLRSHMLDASERGDEELLATALSTFAKVAVDAMILAARQGVVLDVHPSNYAEREGRVFYLDDDIAAGERCPSIGYSLLHRVEEYEGWSSATEAYLTAIERQIAARITRADLTRLDLHAAVAQVLVRSQGGMGARDRLVRTLEAQAPGRD